MSAEFDAQLEPIPRSKPQFAAVQSALASVVGPITPAAQLVIRWRGRQVFAQTHGWLDPETRQQLVQPNTLFDIASVTKLFAVSAFLTLVEASAVALDQPVCSVLPEFSGARPIQPYEDPLNPGNVVAVAGAGGSVDAEAITFRRLLTHTSGLPAWRPLYQQPNAGAARRMAIDTFFSYPPGAQVVYSDVGLILLGLALERLASQALDTVIRQRVTGPLDLSHTRYLPLSSPAPPPGHVVPTEFCQWRGRRVAGQVHDENAYQLGGVSAHAGLFSTASDIAAFGQTFLDRPCAPRGTPLLRPATVDEMTRCQTPGLGSRRGLGFLLWLPDPQASGNPFSQRAFGHTGFTGASLWIDPTRDLVVALLTNEVYNGRKNRQIIQLRLDVHRAIVAAVDDARSVNNRPNAE
jgi:CubicO group peptidase (beta-lactamase class C family)